MASIDIFVSQYSRDPADKMPFHWEIVAKLREETVGNIRRSFGNVYQILGSTNLFHYSPQYGIYYDSSMAFRGALRVGSIRSSDLPRLETLLSQVEVRSGDRSWNCQTWTHLGLRRLIGYELGIEHQYVDMEALVAGMERTYTLWDTGDA